MSRGRFGKFGGQYVPETLMNELIRLEEQYNYYKNDPAFNAELTELLNNYAGRPSRLYYAEKTTSRERISITPALTRSTIVSDRCCWPKRWERRA